MPTALGELSPRTERIGRSREFLDPPLKPFHSSGKPAPIDPPRNEDGGKQREPKQVTDGELHSKSLITPNSNGTHKKLISTEMPASSRML